MLRSLSQVRLRWPSACALCCPLTSTPLRSQVSVHAHTHTHTHSHTHTHTHTHKHTTSTHTHTHARSLQCLGNLIGVRCWPLVWSSGRGIATVMGSQLNRLKYVCFAYFTEREENSI